MKTKQMHPSVHELTFLAKELNHGIRQLLERVDTLREELFLEAKAEKNREEDRRSRPVCGTKKESGGTCRAPIEPGQFRCSLHAAELARNRKRRVGRPRLLTAISEGQGASPGPDPSDSQED